MAPSSEPKKISDSDNRAHPRVICEIEAQIRTLDEPENSTSISDMRHKDLHFRVRNVSMGGLFLESPPPLKNGEILRIQAHLPGTPAPIKAFGEVAWSGSQGGGLRFLAMAEESLEVLKNYISGAEPVAG